MTPPSRPRRPSIEAAKQVPAPEPGMAGQGQPEERRLLEDTGKLSGATAASYLINLAGGIVIARILGPALMGIWKAVQLAGTYSAFANLGTTYGIDRTCPSIVSRGRMRTYRRLIASSSLFTLCMSVLIAVCVVAFALPLEAGPERLAFFAFAIFVLVQPFYQHGEASLNVEKRFGVRARVTFISTTARIILSIIGAWLFGLAGVLAAFILVLAWSAWYMLSRTRAELSLGAIAGGELALIRRLVHIGLPITLLVSSEQLFLTIDKWLVLCFLGAEPHGLYQMAILPLPILMLVPMALRQVVSMDVYDKFGRTGDLKACQDVFERSVTAIALGTPFIVGAVWLGVPWLVDWFLEDYRSSILSIKIHSVGIYPVLIIQTAFAIAVIAKKERRTVQAFVLAALAASAVSVVCVKGFGADFQVVLVVHALSWLIFGIGFLYYCLRWLKYRPEAAWHRIARWFFPMLFLAVELPLLELLLRSMLFTPHTFLFAITGGLIHTVCCLPFFYGLEKRTRGISHVLGMVRSRLGGR